MTFSWILLKYDKISIFMEKVIYLDNNLILEI